MLMLRTPATAGFKLSIAIAIAAALGVPSMPTQAADAGAATVAAAAADAGEPRFDRLDRIVVAATLSATEVASLPSVVSSIGREQLDRELAFNLRDAVRYEPGVSVRSSFGRFGLSDFRIRGLQGNRVLIETDGIDVSDAFSIGSFSSAGRIALDPSMLKTMEIVRGPGSSLYGSDALGGVVSLRTLEPSDLVTAEDPQMAALRMGYSAFAGSRWSGLLMGSWREGEAPRNQGEDDSENSTRTRPNPQDTRQGSLLAKLGFTPDAGQQLMLSIEGHEARALTEVLSSRGTSAGIGLPVRVLDLDGDDRQTRARVSLQHHWDGIGARWIDGLRWQLYRQDSETTQLTREQRVSLSPNGPINPSRREREFNFDQRVYGVEASAHTELSGMRWKHRLSWGVDVSRSEIRSKRDGRSTQLSTGAVSPVIPPDVFPVRDFPISTVDTSALFVQDEIESADGRWRLIPALRIDHFKLDPELDPIFAQDNPGILPQPVSETSLAPKFGVVHTLGETYSVFGGYSRGFRSPPYSDVNLGFTNLQFGYTAIPNPELKPETSDGIELGLRRRDANFWWTLSGYINRYQDFIESLRSLGVDPRSGLLVFQSQNVSRAQIHGIELQGGFALGSLWPALEAFELRFAAATARGKDRDSERPLSSTDPANGVLGLRWMGTRSSLELVLRGAAAQTRAGSVTVPVGETPAFAAPGYGVLDLLYELEFAGQARLNLGVFNLADRHYWEWAALPQIAASSGVLDRYTAPGRYLSAQLEIRF
jgi:hemoglobin/transferrin/lactoferrin receptor protein